MQEVGCKKAHEKTDAKGYAKPHGHLDEEIARQSNSENSFGNIGKEFSKELLFSFVKDCHQMKAYHNEEGLSNIREEDEIRGMWYNFRENYNGYR